MQTYCSIAFEITTLRKESKPHMNRAALAQAFRIMCGFVVNLKGVWQDLCLLYED